MPTDTPPPADQPPVDTPPPAAKWFEGERFAHQRPWIDAKGYGVDDPLDALERVMKSYSSAEKLIGKGVDNLIERPSDPTKAAEWMRANAALFGLPESPEKYDVAKPTLPEGVKWDEQLEAEARKIAHEEGVRPQALNRLIAAYGDRLGGLLQDSTAQQQAANTEMMAALERDWGQAAPQKIGEARAAAAAIAEKAGLTPEAIADVTQALALKVGDAAVVKLFATIGEMMGEDRLANPPGGGGFGQTPAEAKARLAAMDAPDGEFGKAFATQNRAEMARLTPIRNALIQIAAR